MQRFGHILTLQCGWLLCITGSNSACLQVVKGIAKYPILHPFLVHSFSKMYQAFHEDDFELSIPFRVTKKMLLNRHGIMVCTLGHLPSVLKKFAYLSDAVIDLVTDESGQIWDWDALLMLPELPNVVRWYQSGDGKQLPPHVIRTMTQRDEYYPSIMSVEVGTGRVSDDHMDRVPYSVFLRVQYRTIPEICEVHAATFYSESQTGTSSREIVTYRAAPTTDTDIRGIFYERVPTFKSSRELMEWEAKRALGIYQTIRKRGMVNAKGKPWTFFILTPYTETMQYMIDIAQRQSLSGVTISTVDRVQGCEADAVILTTSRNSCVDLCRDRCRGNVAMSRQRDLLIIMTHAGVTGGTERINCHDSKHRKLRFWAHMVAGARLWNPKDRQALWLQEELKSKIELESRAVRGDEKARTSVGFKVRMIRQRASRALKMIDEYRDGNLRKSLCKELVLLKKVHKNKPIHMMLFGRLYRANRSVFTSALTICANASTTHDRNRQLGDLLGVDYGNIVVDQLTKRLVISMYE